METATKVDPVLEARAEVEGGAAEAEAARSSGSDRPTEPPAYGRGVFYASSSSVPGGLASTTRR